MAGNNRILIPPKVGALLYKGASLSSMCENYLSMFQRDFFYVNKRMLADFGTHWYQETHHAIVLIRENGPCEIYGKVQ